MNFLKRAYLHTTRKKGKTFLLFAFLLVMSTLMLTCISIYSATDKATSDVRKSLMGSFTINAKQLSSGLNDSVVNDVLTIEGVTDNYNLRSYTQAAFRSSEGGLMEICTEGAANVPEGYEHAGKIVGNRFSEKDSYFTDAGFKLVQGNPITPESTQAALIHESFADKIHLSVGDYFTLENIENAAHGVRVQVIGMFTNTSPQDAIGIAPSYDLYQNVIFTDVDTCSQLLYTESGQHCQYGDFYVEDPEELENLISQVKSISNVDWDNCIITKYDKDYQNAKASLHSLQNIVFVAISIIAVVSIILLTLILTLWVRNRVHEMGVFLAMGITKGNILLQQISEAIIVALTAFLLSFGTSNLIAQMVSDRLTQKLLESLSVSVLVAPLHWGIVSLLGICLVVLATVLSAYPLMRTNPKNILSQMN